MWLIGTALGLAILGTPSAAIAGESAMCTCATRYRTVADEVDAAQAVFTARVMQRRPYALDPRNERLIVAVQRVWKGTPRLLEQIVVPEWTNDCTTMFMTGMEYLITIDAQHERYTVSTCEWERPLSRAEEMLDYLGEAEVVHPPLLPDSSTHSEERFRASLAIRIVDAGLVSVSGAVVVAPGFPEARIRCSDIGCSIDGVLPQYVRIVARADGWQTQEAVVSAHCLEFYSFETRTCAAGRTYVVLERAGS